MREYLERVRETSPLIHNITNYVTVNDCANILLACGGSPIMADDPEEAEEITSICGGLNINIGTLNQHTISAMGLAGEIAEKRMKPEDGNSSFRNYLIDAVYHLQGETLEKGARYEVR